VCREHPRVRLRGEAQNERRPIDVDVAAVQGVISFVY
jgi:hypothetical protein